MDITIKPIRILNNIDSIISKLIGSILEESNEELKETKNRTQKIVEEIKILRTNLRNDKNRILHLNRENKKNKSLYKILKDIQYLKSEGLLVGNDRNRFKKLLDNITTYELSQLSKIQKIIEDKLKINYNNKIIL